MRAIFCAIIMNPDGELYVVTSRDAKRDAWTGAWGRNASKVPAGFQEDEIHKQAPKDNPLERVVYIAGEKARQHLETRPANALLELDALLTISYLSSATSSNLLPPSEDRFPAAPDVYLFVDTIQLIHRKGAKNPPTKDDDRNAVWQEKPTNVDVWLANSVAGAMAASGSMSEILTSVHIVLPQQKRELNLILRSIMYMREYTLDEVGAWVKETGDAHVLETAGGFSFFNGGAWIVDRNMPLNVYLQNGEDGDPRLVESFDTLPELNFETARGLVYGAHPALIAEAVSLCPDLQAQALSF